MTLEHKQNLTNVDVTDARLDRIEHMLENLDRKNPEQLDNIEGMINKNHSTLQNKFKDLAFMGLLLANLFMNLLSLFDLSVSLATHDVPILECSVRNPDTGKIECYRPTELSERLVTPKILEVEPKNHEE